jgi:hypothetical protein
VLSESSQSLSHGFREVTRSKVNQAGHWEGIGHFSYVYYKDEKLCQCGRSEVSISTTGSHAIFVDTSTGKLILFQAGTRVRTELSKKYIGHPKSATWEGGRVKVTVERYDDGRSSVRALTIQL